MLVDIAVEEIVMSVGCLHKLLVDASMKILPSLSDFSFRLCRDLLRFLRSSDRNLDIVNSEMKSGEWHHLRSFP